MKWDQIQEVLEDHTIIKILYGPSGSGKTVMMYYLFELLKEKVYLPYLPESLNQFLPSYICVVPQIRDVPHDSVLGLDDLGIHFLARDSGTETSKLISKYLTICRQSGHNIFLAIQNAALLDVNFFRSKEFFIFQKTTRFAGRLILHEREENKDFLYYGHLHLLQNIPLAFLKYYSYIFDFNVFFRVGLPSFWNPILSVPYRDYYRSMNI